MWGECLPLLDAFASKHLKRFPNFWTQQQNALFQPWNDAYLWMHHPMTCGNNAFLSYGLMKRGGWRFNWS